LESKAHILVSAEGDTVTIRVEGSMDLRIYHQLQALARRHRSRQGLRYVFDWSQTSQLHDSGVATLINFREWIAEQNAVMEFVNCASHIHHGFLQSGALKEFVAHLPKAPELLTD
jgi:anti-anti-sigma regulatory factor